MQTIAFDLLRLFLGPMSAAPRGIDRVDLGYALHLFRNRSINCLGVLPTPFGPRVYDRDFVLQFEPFFDRMWGESVDPSADPVFADLNRALTTDWRPPDPSFEWKPVAGRLPIVWRYNQMLWSTPWSFGRGLSALPQECTYLNIGQIGLGQPRQLAWLRRRPDIRPVFMLHDVIPLTHPEVVSAGNIAIHERILATAMDYARGLLVPSEAAKASIVKTLQDRRARPFAVEAVPLPINEIFTSKTSPELGLAARPYFLICGSIEIRKNHMLLLRVWQRLQQRLGDRTPMLVIAGAPGFGGQGLLDFIAAHPAIRPHVVFALNMSTAGIRDAMAAARAVLMPSFAEGFGLPPVEALSTGTPAVLSDIDAHRESSEGYGIFLDPNDVDGWTDAVLRLIEDDAALAALRAKIADFRPTTWDSHIAQVLAILKDMG